MMGIRWRMSTCDVGQGTVTAGLLEVAIIAGQGTREWFLIVYVLMGNIVIQGMGYLMDAAPNFEVQIMVFRSLVFCYCRCKYG